jgi:predicted O-methyltransferase YrrM
MEFTIKPLKNIEGKAMIHWGELISKLALFCHAETIVEIGVQNGECTKHLCKAMAKTNGFVYGYDLFEPIPGTAYATASYGSLKETKKNLKGFNNYKLHKVDTRTIEFDNLLKEDFKKSPIDIAFIDACHSYSGAFSDFRKIYPYLSKTGIVIFHDTYSHNGLRKLNIDLRTIYYDGTYDLIELPFGRGGRGKSRLGLSILVKRSFAHTNSGIINTKHDKNSDFDPKKIYDYENKFLEKEINNYKERSIKWQM